MLVYTALRPHWTLTLYICVLYGRFWVMPKMKTKSSAKKRFKITATGKIKVAQMGKRHGMIKRSKKFIRNARGTAILGRSDSAIVRRFMPNSHR